MKLFVTLFVLVCIVNRFTLNVFAPVAPQVITRPQIALVSRGSPRVVPLPTKAPERNYIQYKAIVTKYCACEICCEKSKNDPEYGITASGKRVKEGMVALPREFPFGTKIYIPEFGNLICEDRGGAIRRINDQTIKIDIYVKSHNEAEDFGLCRTTARVFK